jgi:chemotaxis signal transduction protein
MITDEYLVARVGALYFGIYCGDVKNVYSRKLKLAKLHYQSNIFRGITHINGVMTQVIDLRRRIGMASEKEPDVLTLVSFQTDMSNMFAVVVDEIIGMKTLRSDSIRDHPGHMNNTHENINLLFPMMAILDDDMMIHLLDSTYLDKTEPVIEEAGDLELF